MSAQSKQNNAEPQPTNGVRTQTGQPTRSSLEVERGSVSQNDGGAVQPKPSQKGPEDLSYSMDRWLQQQPREEPWRPARRG